jgi:hypothetical protein
MYPKNWLKGNNFLTVIHGISMKTVQITGALKSITRNDPNPYIYAGIYIYLLLIIVHRDFDHFV